MALAAPPPPAPGAPSEGPENCGWKSGDHHKHFEEKLKKLHEELKLSAAQEKGWTDWTSQLTQGRDDWKARKDEASTPPAKALDRMERKLAHLKDKEKHLEAHIAATQTFYATLTTNQKQTFDSEFAKHSDRRHPPEAKD
jgi:hypothetical protein